MMQPGDKHSRNDGPRSRSRRRAARRAQACRRLQRMRLKRAIRASGVTRANAALTNLASETIQLIEQRIRYWMKLGDEEHVKRLEAVRQQLITTYRG